MISEQVFIIEPKRKYKAEVNAAIYGQQQWGPAEEDDGSKDKLIFLQIHQPGQATTKYKLKLNCQEKLRNIISNRFKHTFIKNQKLFTIHLKEH